MSAAVPLYKKSKVADLIPYANNARTHSEEQVAQIAASIQEFGFLAPIVIDGENGVIAGHGRLLACQKLGWEEVPTIEASHLTKAQRKAYVIADNKLAMNAGWDMGLLKVEIDGLSDLGFDIGLLGFSGLELKDILADRTEGLTDPDDAPAVQAEVVSELGDVWLLGSHRLVCGDCTDASVVDKCLAGARPNLMVTEPPYGVEYDASWRDFTGLGSVAHGKVLNDDRADWREAYALFAGDVAYVWHAGLKTGESYASLEAVGLLIRSQIIWNKTFGLISRSHYNWQHELCWYAVRRGKQAAWSGDKKQTTVWDIPKNRSNDTGHSTQKPVECMRRPIENNSSPGQAVYEPFCGSGTTIVACEQTGRVCLAIELAPEYVDVCVRRWQAFAGKEAVLEETGKTFEQTQKERTHQAASA